MDARHHRAIFWAKILGQANLRFPMFRIFELLLRNRTSYQKETGPELQRVSRNP